MGARSRGSRTGFRRPGRTRRREQGSLRTPAAARCSLLQPTGSRRTLAVVRCDLTALHDAAHARGATVDDAYLTAVTGALHELLRRRGESVTDIVAGVPISVRAKGNESGLRNRIVPVRVALPAVGPTEERLQRTSTAMQTRKAAVSAGSVPALVGWMLHAAGRVGLYAWFADRQRSIHTSISDVPGPAAPLRFAGLPIVDIVPLSVGGGGNVTLAFVMLSYLGTLTTTIVADPDRAPDLAELAMLLHREFEAIAKLPAT